MNPKFIEINTELTNSNTRNWEFSNNRKKMR